MSQRDRERAKELAAAGASAAKIERKTGVSEAAASKFVDKFSSGGGSSASMKIQQPMPDYNRSTQDARYITDLNPVGSPEYNRWNERLGGNYDGGGWVTWNKNFGPGDSGQLASDDFMRSYARANAYREMNNIGLMGQGSVEADAARFSAPNAAAGSSSQTRKKSYKDVGSIRGGLKIGMNNILGAQEARKISRATGRPQDKVIAKALESGFGIGGNLVNQSNKAFRPSMNPLAVDPLSAMRGIETGGKGQMYSGSYKLDGETMPIVQTRRGGASKLSIGEGGMGGAGGRRRGGKGKRGKGGRGGAADMGTDMGTTAQQQPMSDYMPPMMDEPLPEPDININMPGVGEDVFNQATGFKSKRSRRRMAGRQAQGLASQRVSPLGAWRFGT
jgi:hypothetical protein